MTAAELVVCGPGWNGEPVDETLATERGPERWCFGERKRRAGTWELLGTREPSHWEPFWQYRCDGCGEDRRLFPGWSEWSE